MARRPVRIWLEDIRDEIAGIRDLTCDATRDTFANSWAMKRAVEHALLIISEATRHVSQEHKSRHPEIAWKNIHDLGNMLRHQYRHIDPNILWSIIESDLAPLDRAMAGLLAELPPE